ncbi:MAG: nucleotidyltransferase family protein [Anaerolineae bacterium]|nr:nucleotidyltransferase family protein [Anaerolineae bacterium]
MPSAPPTDPTLETLLAVCAQAVGHPALYTCLTDAVKGLRSYEGLAARAEAHGLAPLVYTHLQAADIALPPPAQDELLAYYLLHAHVSRVRGRALAEILAAFQSAGIEVLLLKGAALAYLVYPRPHLRPMRDIDLLVPAQAAARAQAVLLDLGFTEQGPPALSTDHHLPPCERIMEGQLVSVEVHRGLDPVYMGGPLQTFADLASTAQTFTLHGVPAATLGREETLWHIYRHTFLNHWYYEWPRLMGVADIVSLVEAWADQMDWDRLRHLYPAAYRILPLLDQFTPWSAKTRQRLGSVLRQGRSTIGETLLRWPRSMHGLHDDLAWQQAVRERLFPPALWLRLTHGYGPSRLDLGRAWLAHQHWLWSRYTRNRRFVWQQWRRR